MGDENPLKSFTFEIVKAGEEPDFFMKTPANELNRTCQEHQVTVIRTTPNESARGIVGIVDVLHTSSGNRF